MDVHTEETTPRFARDASQSIESVFSYVITRLKAESQPRSPFALSLSYHRRRFPFTTLIHQNHLSQSTIEEGKALYSSFAYPQVGKLSMFLSIYPHPDLVNIRSTHLPGRLLLIC
jgi:hypothetical protein